MAENAAIRAAIGMGIFDLFSRRDSFYLSEIAHLTGAEYGLVCQFTNCVQRIALTAVCRPNSAGTRHNEVGSSR